MAEKKKNRIKQVVVDTYVKNDGTPNKAGYMVCNICGGTGVQKVPTKKNGHASGTVNRNTVKTGKSVTVNKSNKLKK